MVDQVHLKRWPNLCIGKYMYYEVESLIGLTDSYVWDNAFVEFLQEEQQQEHL
jgi:hypothetical protein